MTKLSFTQHKKLTLEQAVKARRGSRRITRWGGLVGQGHALAALPTGDPVPIVQEAGWDPCPGHPAHSKSLYDHAILAHTT